MTESGSELQTPTTPTVTDVTKKSARLEISDAQPAAEQPSPRTKAVACLLYGMASTCITLFNRAVFSLYQFNFPSFVTMLQILVSIVYMYVFKWTGGMEFGRLTMAGCKKVAPLALFWWLYVVSGVTALRYLNVPMFSVLRRSTVLCVVVGEYYMFGKRLTGRSQVALALMVGGAGVAGLTDLTFSLPGYIWVTVCVVSTAVYLIMIKLLKDVTGLGSNTLLLYNNLLALPLMAAHLVLGTDELSRVWSFPELWDPGFQVFLLISCSQAFLLNLCIFRCTLVNSPLATNVTGQMKDIATTGLGMVLFHDVRYSALNIIGIALGLVGSIGYSTVSFLGTRGAGAAAAAAPVQQQDDSSRSGSR